MAKESKLTSEVVSEILSDIEAGLHPEVSAQAAGVATRTFQEWMTRGKRGEEPYASFRGEVARAKAVAEKTLLQRALGGDGAGRSFGPGKAALEILSRTLPDRYSATHKMQLRDDLERILSVVERVCGPESFLAVCEALADENSSGEAGEAEGNEPTLPH